MSSRTQYEGGSLLSFAIVATVLVLVFVGGLYGLQRYSHYVADQKDTEVATDTNHKSTPHNDNQSANNDTNKKSDQSAQSTTPSTKNDATTKDDTDVSPLSPAEKDTAPSATQEQTSDALPETGPADAAAQFIALGLLAFMATAYIRSRHAL